MVVGLCADWGPFKHKRLKETSSWKLKKLGFYYMKYKRFQKFKKKPKKKHNKLVFKLHDVEMLTF